ncbi:hypothetical protein [Aquabacterium sp.]|uniref:hypothetical protein n=1 Tax=Aquabacterium sp. TaxID=1872578 RepID=UPI0027B9786F|nr:hypothetical protein [Aquabacterium sp.]
MNHKTPDATKVYVRLMLRPVRIAMEEATSTMPKAGELCGRSPWLDWKPHHLNKSNADIKLNPHEPV